MEKTNIDSTIYLKTENNCPGQLRMLRNVIKTFFSPFVRKLIFSVHPINVLICFKELPRRSMYSSLKAKTPAWAARDEFSQTEIRILCLKRDMENLLQLCIIHKITQK